jgi:PAS domain S-box-containing protein
MWYLTEKVMNVANTTNFSFCGMNYNSTEEPFRTDTFDKLRLRYQHLLDHLLSVIDGELLIPEFSSFFANRESEFSPDLLLKINAEGYFRTVQPHFTELFIPGNLLSAKHISEVFSEKLSNYFLKEIEGTIKKQGVSIINYSIGIPGKGNYFQEGRLIASGKNEVLAIIRDFTNEKAALLGLKEALKENKENKEFLEKLINMIPDIIGIQDHDHHIIRYNEAGYRFLNLNPEEIKGYKCYHLIGRDFECEDCVTATSYNTKLPSSNERYVPEKDIWLDIRSYPVLDDDGNIKYIIEHLRDITRLKKTELALRKSEERYRELFDSSVGGILLGSEDGVIIEANRTFCEMTGYSREELIGRHISHNLFTPESIEKHPFRFDLLKQGKKVVSERELLTRNGGIIAVEMHTHIMPDSTYQSIYHDISDRKKAELEIQKQTESLKALNAEKDRFFSIVAHDLRSPFSAILGLTEMIADDFENMETEELRVILSELRKSTGNLYNLLDNLLEWSMLQRNKKPFNPEKHDLRRIISVSLETLFESANYKQIQVFLNQDEDINVYADRNMLEAVIRNLFTNAVKFSHPGGKILIDSKCPEPGFAELSITDSGIGIPEDMIKQLFLVSARNNRRGTAGEPSTGLGLLLCKEFIEKNGGSIKAESTENEGSKFTIKIPLALD